MIEFPDFGHFKAAVSEEQQEPKGFVFGGVSFQCIPSIGMLNLTDLVIGDGVSFFARVGRFLRDVVVPDQHPDLERVLGDTKGLSLNEQVDALLPIVQHLIQAYSRPTSPPND